MSERQTSPYGGIARKWLALVERRQEHFIELCNSGRWRHYYTKVEFLDEMRKLLRVRDQWAAIAGLPLSDDDPEDFLGPDDFSHLPPVKPRPGMPVTRWPD
jgi:uncharacterized repeat protein (TIGR03809 family)